MCQPLAALVFLEIQAVQETHCFLEFRQYHLLHLVQVALFLQIHQLGPEIQEVQQDHQDPWWNIISKFYGIFWNIFKYLLVFLEARGIHWILYFLLHLLAHFLRFHLEFPVLLFHPKGNFLKCKSKVKTLSLSNYRLQITFFPSNPSVPGTPGWPLGPASPRIPFSPLLPRAPLNP